GNVLVSVTATNMVSRSISLTFRNGKAGINLPQTTINTAGLFPMMGGGISSFANTTVEGGAYQEIQTITLSNATSGTWRVAYNGEISAALATSITAADLKTALDAFIGIDNATVTGSSGSFTVTFGGTQSTTNMSQIFGDAASASCGATISTITSTYDANDQLTSISDPSATINLTLDNLGRATSIANTIAGLTPTVTLAQNFNAAGNRTELKATIGSTLDFRNTYQFDTLGRVTEMIQQSQAGGNAVTAKRAAFEYNKLNQRTSLTRYQSTGTSNLVAATDYTYDTVNRLSSLTHKQNSTTLAGYTYGYDGASRLTSVTSTVEGLSTYTYDATSQVVGADHAVGGQADETYGYDLNGNRNTSGYTTSTNNRTTADPGFTYTYDDQGNRTSRTETATGKVTEYSWDHRNRLVTVKDRNTAGGSVVKQVDYAYDAFNRLVKRTFDADGAGSGTATNQYWVYDEGINAVLQFDGSSASNLSHRYLWSDRVDELLADETVGSGADTLYALGDHLGTIRDIANFNESTAVTSVTNHRTYNSFGKLVSETNAAVDLIFGFTGKQLDEATGLQHNLFRWYDSSLGQWLSEDPMGFAAGDENVRRYVGNAATNLSDPSGLVGVGHHWVSMAQLMKHATKFEKDALLLLIGSYSGLLQQAHNRRRMGDVTHFEYDEAINRALKDFLDNRKSKDLVSPAEAQQFAQDVYDGKVFNAADGVRIKKFNQAIVTEVKSLTNSVEPAKAKTQDLIDKGTAYAQSGRGKQILRAAKFASMIGALAALKGGKDLIDESANPLQITFRYIEAGDYSGARDAMLGNSATSMVSVLRKQNSSGVFAMSEPKFEALVTDALTSMKMWEASFFHE
ncbi:MAG: RHS repeat-associated core domain-containing protein, partial [Pirellulaceae bacterium]|nr:RHS repeat-associated core domain-containing protein [Pirellulaceae bacterium]